MNPVTYDMYDGKVKLTYNDPDHKYLVSKKIGDKWLEATPVTGVSTYCGALSKDFLAPWAAKLAAEYIQKNAARLGQGTTWAQMVDEAKKQHKIAGDVGKRAGKLGHLYVEARLNDQKITMPTDPADLIVVESVASAFDAFMADWRPEILEIEKVLYSREHNFAGTCDAVVNAGGKLIILDWKTTNTSRYNPDGIYATYFAQLGAYCICYEEMTGDVVDELWVVNLPKSGGEYKLKRLEDIGMTRTDCIAYFLNLKQAYEINQKFEWSIK